MTIAKYMKWGISCIRIIILKVKYRSQICFDKKNLFNIYIGKYCAIKIEGTAKIILGQNVYIDNYMNIHLENDAMLKIGDNVYFNEFCRIAAKEKINIGSNVMFGSNVSVFDHDHDISRGVFNGTHNYICRPVHIHDNVWCGANVVILKGSIIEENSVVAANAVVTTRISSGIWAGVPAVKIKEI